MPRPNQPRSLDEERNLAERIAYGRQQRGWSYAEMARRMTEAGCPINQSAIYKIEKDRPPRRITVTELVALGRVFDTDIMDLLVPSDVRSDVARDGEWVEHWRIVQDRTAVQQTWRDARDRLAALSENALPDTR